MTEYLTVMALMKTMKLMTGSLGLTKAILLVLICLCRTCLLIAQALIHLLNF